MTGKSGTEFSDIKRLDVAIADLQLQVAWLRLYGIWAICTVATVTILGLLVLGSR
jgi:hypothetical protein